MSTLELNPPKNIPVCTTAEAFALILWIKSHRGQKYEEEARRGTSILNYHDTQSIWLWILVVGARYTLWFDP